MTGDPFALALTAQGLKAPAAVTRFHTGPPNQLWSGTADIERGTAWLLIPILWLAAFPPTGADVPITVRVTRSGEWHVWTRQFGAHQMRSRLRYRPSAQLIEERIGPFTVRLKPELDGERLRITVAGFRFAGIPLPRILWPDSQSEEFDAEGRFGFDIGARLPLLGLLIRYHGTLTPQAAP